MFALLHELGHAHIQEMGLPVLGKEEDAADSYAVLALLKVGTEVSHNVLVQATKGWFLSAARDQQEGTPVAFYDEHGMEKQRAYQIVCLMVGSDPDQFADLANQTKMPESRQGRARAITAMRRGPGNCCSSRTCAPWTSRNRKSRWPTARWAILRFLPRRSVLPV